MVDVEWEMHRAGDCLGPAIVVYLAAGQTIEDARTSVQLDRWEPLWDEGRPLPGTERSWLVAGEARTLVVPVRPRLKPFLDGNGRTKGGFVVWYGLSTEAGRRDAESRLKQWTFLWERKVAGAQGGWVVPVVQGAEGE